MFKEIRHYKFAAILALLACLTIYFFEFYSYYHQKNIYEKKQANFKRLSKEVFGDVEFLVNKAQEETEKIITNLQSYGSFEKKTLIEDPVELKFLISKKVGQWQEKFHAPNNYFGFENCCQETAIADQASIFHWNLLLNVTEKLLTEVSLLGIEKIYCYEESNVKNENLKGLITVPIHLKFEGSMPQFRAILERVGSQLFPLFLKSAEVRLLEKNEGKGIFGLNFEYIQYLGKEDV